MPQNTQLIPSGKTYSIRQQSFFARPKFSPIIQSHPIPKLPIFDKLANQLLKLPIPDANKTILVCRQHNLETTANVYRFAKQLGLTVFGTGKIYSSAPSVRKTISDLGVHLFPDAELSRPGDYQEAAKKNLEQLWDMVRKHAKAHDMHRIILLDDGGGLFEVVGDTGFFYHMAGVEQTRGGLYSPALGDNSLFPIIDVAGSAAKREIESPLIAKAVVEKVISYVPTLKTDKNCICGVIGNGAIGSALVKYLLGEGYTVVICDSDGTQVCNKLKAPNLYKVENIELLIKYTNYIFGCSGADTSAGLDISRLYNDKTFINCASEDREFRTFLRQVPTPKNYHPLANIIYTNTTRSVKITFIYGGFPINFAPLPQTHADGKTLIPDYPDTYSVPNEDIQLTRSLIILGLTQSLLSATRPEEDSLVIHGPQPRQCLNPLGQRAIATMWLQERGRGRFSPEVDKNFQDLDWIMQHSGGKYVPNKQLEDCIAQLPIRYDEPSPIETLQTPYAPGSSSQIEFNLF